MHLTKVLMLWYKYGMSRVHIILLKVSFGLLGFSAIVTEIAVLIERSTFNFINFFSYFTVLSNIFAALTLFISAYYLASRKKSANLAHIRGATTLYMIVTGVVFSLLLANFESSTLTAVPWDNIVLHYIMPIVVILDWLLDRPYSKVSFQKALYWLVFPLIYIAYSLLRGAATGWYPYPFLNPAHTNYQAVIATVLTIFIGGIAVIYFLTRVKK